MKLLNFPILFFMALFAPSLYSQEVPEDNVWSLERCIEYAHENNLVIKQQSVNAQTAHNQYNQSKAERYPNLNASTGFTTRFGRVRDDTSYELRDITTRFTDVNVSSTTPIFEGFTRQNSIERRKLDWQAALKDIEQAHHDIALNIASLYMQILFDKELLEAARRQLDVVELQVERTKKLVESGSVPRGNLLEMRSLSASEVLNVTRLENNLDLSLLDLAHALDLDDTSNFDIETPQELDMSAADLLQASAVFDQAVSSMPHIEAAKYRLEGRELDVDIAKGYRYPQLSFNMGWGTSATRYSGAHRSFSEMLQDNSSSYFGLSLNIPIFNNFNVRTNIDNARLNVKMSQYQLKTEKQNLNKEIQQAYADAKAAYRQYQAGKTAVESYEESFRYTRQKFEVGMVNPVDYSVAQTEYMNAESEYIQAKYSYILRVKILDFYQGKPLTL
ncbi:TolC family protein [Marinilabiliaceae bacterium ANBcel2]|nr:TolC family protein [Marinilabiliaceae bacterium ANBcel2]